jgi:hypothetical protein
MSRWSSRVGVEGNCNTSAPRLESGAGARSSDRGSRSGGRPDRIGPDRGRALITESDVESSGASAGPAASSGIADDSGPDADGPHARRDLALHARARLSDAPLGDFGRVEHPAVPTRRHHHLTRFAGRSHGADQLTRFPPSSHPPAYSRRVEGRQPRGWRRCRHEIRQALRRPCNPIVPASLHENGGGPRKGLPCTRCQHRARAGCSRGARA